MASEEKLTEYERKRLENIRRNQELIASLKIHSTISHLSSVAKRARTGDPVKSFKSRQPKPPPPPVTRRSLRTRGMPPDSSGPSDDMSPAANNARMFGERKQSTACLGPYPMSEAYEGPSGSDRTLISSILWTPCVDSNVHEGKFGQLNFDTMTLKPENIARILPGRITAVKFFPRSDIRMIVAGNRYGTLAFWNVDSKDEEGKEDDNNGIFLYRPHSGPISAVVFQQSCPSKIISSSYDGLVRSLDAEKGMFDLVHNSDHVIYSMAQNSSLTDTLFFGDGNGDLVVWDCRDEKSSSRWKLHEKRINSIDFNPQNVNILLTSSSDGTASLWDLRRMRADKSNSMASVSHGKSINSSYFSPSGAMFMTTSLDDTVGIVSGVNYDNFTKVYHYNQTGRWLSTFRAIWGWDDSYIFIGNMKRKIDVILSEGRLARSIESDNMSAIPCRFDKHPFHNGTLAGATSGGQVYMWTCD